MKKNRTFRNPILRGTYPDPSICRVGEDYYMVTSSFAYYPGLPVFHSRDLVHWEQIGHGIHRPDQLDYKNGESFLGPWAPTIRYHKGTFYIINTCVTEKREGNCWNYLITAKDPAGPWSDPIHIEEADGIDPSLFFDEDGKIWYIGNKVSADRMYAEDRDIYMQEMDPSSFQLTGERYIIWEGKKTQGKWIEGPHIYKVKGWYYLLVAEGGTYLNHSVQIARSRKINGIYEVCPFNPVLTHRNQKDKEPVFAVGHGDLVETSRGEWWLVLLGIRPYRDGEFNLGRETFLVPMSWDEDGWLKVDNENGCVNLEERFPDLPESRCAMPPVYDNFESGQLGLEWNMIHPPKENFYRLEDGCLFLKARRELLHELGNPSFIGRRQSHMVFEAAAAVEFQPHSEYEEAGIAVMQDHRFHYLLILRERNGKKLVQVYKTEEGIRTLLKEAKIPDISRIYLTVQGTAESYSFYYGTSERHRYAVMEGLDAALLSHSRCNGATGVYLGMYAGTLQEEKGSWAKFDWFSYQGEEM